MNIGTLNEKSIHRELKHIITPDTTKHEIGINRYTVDILDDNTITEIQSKQFNKLRDKLAYYIDNTDYNINIVFPVLRKKIIYWIDPITNNIVDIRKSTIRQSNFDIFKELYKIQEFLSNRRITFIEYIMEVNEYKLLDGYGGNNKIKATKVDKNISNIIDKVTFNINNGYEQFTEKMQGLSEFTTVEFSKINHCKLDIARITLLVLYNIGKVSRIGKRGNLIVYRVDS